MSGSFCKKMVTAPLTELNEKMLVVPSDNPGSANNYQLKSHFLPLIQMHVYSDLSMRDVNNSAWVLIFYQCSRLIACTGAC